MGERADTERPEMVVTGWPVGLWFWKAILFFSRALLLFLIVGACNVLTAGWAHAADFEIREEGWAGCSELWRLARRELTPPQVRVVPELDYGQLKPADGILFLHPLADIHFQSLAAFLAAGGRAAVVDDFGQGKSLLGKFHIQRGSAPSDPRWLAQGDSALPVATPLNGAVAAHPIVRAVDSVVTNHPSSLVPDEDIELTPLLRIEQQDGMGSLFAATGVIGDVEACGLTSGAEQIGRCGRLVAVADPSVFINLMLRYSGNRNFATGLVRYLLAPDSWGARGGNLYILSGEFSQTGSFAGESSLMDDLNERRVRMSRWLSRMRQDGLSPSVVAALALSVGLALAVWSAHVAGKGSEVWGPSFAEVVPLHNQGGFAGRYASLAYYTEDRAMLMLELQRTLEANLRLRLGLEVAASRDKIRSRAKNLGLLSVQRSEKLTRLFATLAAGEAAILSGRRLRVSNRSLRVIRQEIIDTVSAMTPPQAREEAPEAGRT